jgi:AcrR family transcriptional regulator
MPAGKRTPATQVVVSKLAQPAHSANGLGREQVAQIQRARMLTAMVELATERGAVNVTVAHVVARSGVSRRTFYEVFEDREDCFLAAIDDAMARAAHEVIPAYETPGRWSERIRAGLTALLGFLDRERGMGRLLIVESLGAGPTALERRRRALAQIIVAVDQGRAGGSKGDAPSSLTAEGVVGAVSSVIHARLIEPNPRRLVELVNQLMGMIVLPYLGPAAARRELKRPIVKGDDRPRPSARDPLRELGMRLTYRTVRVLLAIAACPDSSNRALAVASGVSDQGQMSKLLSRLEQLGLIENTGAGPARGAPNAWTLTKRGKEIENTIASRSPATQDFAAL